MRFYNLKYIEKVADNIGSLTRRNNARGAESTNDVSTTVYSISDLYGFVKKFDNEFSPAPEVNPVLLNEDGTPRVFDHQTNAIFTEFNTKNQRAGRLDTDTPTGLFSVSFAFVFTSGAVYYAAFFHINDSLI